MLRRLPGTLRGPRLPPAIPARVTLRDGVVRWAGGGASAILACGEADVETLDAGRQAALTGAFGRLCRTLEGPVQVLVQVRRVAPPDPGQEAHGPADATRIPALPAEAVAAVRDGLLAAEDDHLRAVLLGTPCFRASVLVSVVATDGDPDAVERGAAAVLDALTAGGIAAGRLRGDALRARIAEAWGAEPHMPDGVGSEWGRGPVTCTLRPPPWRESAGHARVGGVMVRGVALRRLPGVRVPPGWLRPLLTAGAECDVSLWLAPVEVADAIGRLQRRLRDLRADQLVEMDRESLGDAAVEAGLDGAFELRARLARNEGRPLLMSLCAVARGRTVSELDRSSRAVRTAFASTLAHGEPAHLRHLEAAASAWPGAGDRLGLAKLVDTAAAATCLPWVSAGCDDPGGYPLGRAIAGGAPVRVAPFDPGPHVNANVAVLAASGQGKSYTVGALLLAAAARGVGGVVVDPEGEYRGLVAALGGEYVQLAPARGVALNIFDVVDPGVSPRERHAETVAAVVDLLDVLCGGLDDVERAHVDAAASAALERDGEQAPVLGDCLPDLERTCERIAPVLRRFCSGPLGELFNRPTSVRLDAGLVGIGLRDLKPEFVPAATLVVAEWLWSVVRRGGVPRHIVFDEVGLLCAHAPLRTLLVQLARRCRKYSASLVVATQNAGDLLATPEGQVIATNPAIVLLGGHRSAETSRMAETYGLVPAHRRFLECAGRGEFLLLAGSRRLAVRIEVPALHHRLLTAGLQPAERSGGAGRGTF